MTTEFLGDCSIDGCPKPATRNTAHGPLCEGHRKRLAPSREGGTELSAPLEEVLEPRERLRKAATEYADAEEDADYAKADSDLDAAAEALAEAKRAFRRLAQAAESYGSELARKRINESIAQALARARAAGVRLGRPRLLTFEQAAAAVAEAGSIAAAAKALGVNHKTVHRTLKGTPKYIDIKGHGDLHSPRPLLPPDSEESS